MSGISSVPAGTSRRAGGVNVQRPQRSVSGARTNDVDTDKRRKTINNGGRNQPIYTDLLTS